MQIKLAGFHIYESETVLKPSNTSHQQKVSTLYFGCMFCCEVRVACQSLRAMKKKLSSGPNRKVHINSRSAGKVTQSYRGICYTENNFQYPMILYVFVLRLNVPIRVMSNQFV